MIWTDVIQAIVMIGGLLMMFILTLAMIGGFGSVMESIERGGRNTVFRYLISSLKKQALFHSMLILFHRHLSVGVFKEAVSISLAGHGDGGVWALHLGACTTSPH